MFRSGSPWARAAPSVRSVAPSGASGSDWVEPASSTAEDEEEERAAEDTEGDAAAEAASGRASAVAHATEIEDARSARMLTIVDISIQVCPSQN
ncbi:hypothetical protein GCM10010278_14080 [Streptomyces melanogenes]|nr:hypothetical protein GCM10010278_14080 [Streptomyces melanogenes]